MVSAISQFAPVRFSTDDFPERDRVAVCREVIGRNIVRLDFEPLQDWPLHIDSSLRQLPGLGIMSGEISGIRSTRTSELLADGNHDLRLAVNVSGAATFSQRGREVALAVGDAILVSMAEPGAVARSSPGQHIGLQIPFNILAPLVTRVEDAVLQKIPCGTAALRLLTSYLGVLEDNQALATPEVRGLVVCHVHDLVALAIGATRDAEAVARGRGVRAARLRMIKADIIENLSRNELTVHALARRHRLQPRYIQRLFESDGTTFTEFLLGQRLARAHRMLTDPRKMHEKIGGVASDCGFGDLSYFNRCFRSHYGSAPSHVRAVQRLDTT